MTKHLSTHELAEILLKADNKPIYLKELFEIHGQDVVAYSHITGLDEKVVEDGFVFKKEIVKDKPNDNFYTVGDAIVNVAGNDDSEDIKVILNNMTYMLFAKSSCYFDPDIDWIGFFDDPDEPNTQILEHNFKIVVKEGFHPELKEFSLEDALVWYKENFPERI